MAEPKSEPQQSDTQQQDCLDCSDLVESFEHLLNDNEMIDCHFVFIKENGDQDELKENRIGAHKTILSARSKVFKAMFYGPLSGKDEVEIADISMNTFNLMLRYVYTGQTKPDKNDLLGLFYAAEKYDFGKLSNLVGMKLMENLSIDNIMEVYESIDRFQKPEMMKTICSFIENNTLLIVEHENFVHIHRNTLNFVLSQSNLNVCEIQLFNACLRWAKAEATNEQNLIASPAQLREALGDELFLVRIPTMSFKHFLQGPVASGLFDVDEQNQLLKYIGASVKPEDATSDFVARFELNGRNGGESVSLNFDENFKYLPFELKVKDAVNILQFKSSDDFLLHGFFFGRVSVPFSVTCVQLVEQDSSQVFFQQQMPYTTIKEEDKNPTCFTSCFPSPLLISANYTYKLTLILELNEIQTNSHEVVREKFTMQYDRKYGKSPISIEFENITRSDLNIYNLNIY